MIASKEESEKKQAALDFFGTVPLPVLTYNYAIDEVSGGPQLQISPHDTTAQQQARPTSIAYQEDSKAKSAALEFFGSIPIPDTNFCDNKLAGETRLQQLLGIDDVANSSTNSKRRGTKPKKWRNKSGQASLRARYLHDTYVPTLVHCKTVDVYDGGCKPTCNITCSHGCQQHFQSKVDKETNNVVTRKRRKLHF
jgi:hypothetical protein